MKKILYLIAIVILSVGSYFIYERFLFLQKAVLIDAEVTGLLPHEGPPKRPGSKELNLQYFELKGASHTVIGRTPFLGYLRSGDHVGIYIDPDLPEQFMFTSAAEILATPLTTLLFGIGFLISAAMAKPKAEVSPSTT